jgi:hypothetical protein
MREVIRLLHTTITRWTKVESLYENTENANKLYRQWLNYSMATVAIIAYSSVFMWMIMRAGLLDKVPQFIHDWTPEIKNLPTEVDQYKWQAEDVLCHVVGE